jgi:predicted 2-oxoglutarate/Fe(II)-dependent dioxygenase YbiX
MSRPTSRSAEPLSEAARRAYLKKMKSDLGRICESLRGEFCCGGTLSKTGRVQVTIRGKVYTICPPGNICDTPAKRLWDQANYLKEFVGEAKPALFGKGTETLHDPSVRNGRQLAASDFSINIGPEELRKVVKKVQLGLGLVIGVEAELYALNIYEEGGHFETHKDTPRDAGMFGTLVLCLPSVFQGGTLEVEMDHGPTESFFDSGLSFQKDDVELPWCAFFSDADHRVRNVLGGVRVTLTYILRHRSGVLVPGTSPRAQRDEEMVGELTGIFSTLESLSHMDVIKERYRLSFPCQHLYINSLVFGEGDASSPLPLSAIQMLKGRDLLIARAAHEAGLRVYVQPIFTKNRDVRMYLPTFLETGYGMGGTVRRFEACTDDEEDDHIKELLPTTDFEGVKPHDQIFCKDDRGKLLLFETQ